MAALGIVLIVIGAILAWGINVFVEGADLEVIGVILMAAGVIAFIGGLFTGAWGSRIRSERHVSSDGRHQVEESSSGPF